MGGWTNWIYWLAVSSTVLSVWSSFLYGSRKWQALIFDILAYGAYIYFCVAMLFYGELALSVVVIIISTIALFKYRKRTHKVEKIVIQSGQSNRELSIVLAGAIVVAIVSWVVFFLLDGNLAILNAISLSLFLSGLYLTYRVSKWQFPIFIVHSLVLLAIWMLAVFVEGASYGHSIFAIGAGIEAVMYTIAFFRWHKDKRTH